MPETVRQLRDLLEQLKAVMEEAHTLSLHVREQLARRTSDRGHLEPPPRKRRRKPRTPPDS